MERSQIESLFNSGKLKQTLHSIEECTPSPWHDTTKLKCLRAIGGRKALKYAEELHQRILNNSSPYPLNTSERNNQLRYIALVYAEHGEAREACNILRPMCEQSRDVAALYREYAFALTGDSQLDLAERTITRAIDLQPNSAKAHSQLARIYCLTGRVDSGYHSYSKAATLDPGNPSYLQKMLYWSNYSERTSQRSSFQMAKLWAQRAFPGNQAGTNNFSTVDPNRQLKLGFISPDLNAHAVSFYVTPLLEGLERNDFHVTAYSDTKKVDSVTESIKALCDDWCDSSRLSDSKLAKQIARDEIDVLVDLNGHSRGNRLGVFARHEAPAPIQLSWLGYPSTTGLNSIAYRMTDRIADPVGMHEKFFSEKLLRLPNGFLCFKPVENSPKIDPVDNDGTIRFGSFNNLAKISSVTLDCWAAAMHAVPNSTLYLKRQQLVNKRAMNFFVKELADRGIVSKRLIFKTSKATIEEHLAEYNKVDIALDTSPYNGTTTTLEALWMGVPVISLAGDTHASRVSASILYRLNLSGLAAKSVNEFAERAKELTELDETLGQLRATLRDRMRESSLMNSRQFGREFGNTIRSQWRDWCRQAKIAPSAEPEKNDDELDLDDETLAGVGE